MSVVYRSIRRYRCLLLNENCLAIPSPNCKNGCKVYKAWQESGLKAKDYAHQRRVDEFPPASSE
jgi:hypothetical protein